MTLMIRWIMIVAVFLVLAITSAAEEAVITGKGEVINDREGYSASKPQEYSREDVESVNVEGNNNNEGSEDEEENDNVYHEFMDVDHWPYYPEEFERDGRPEKLCGPEQYPEQDDCIVEGQFILSDYVVAGVNLASYNVLHPKYMLFEDFNIGPFLRGNESWKELVGIRQSLERPSLSWYVDKVARKRWLAERGFPQPEIFYMKYKSEIDGSNKREQIATILKNLPTTHGFCAKPTHMSMTQGNWLVDLNPQEEEVKFSRFARRLKANEEYDPADCADSLAEGLRRGAASAESWALKNVEPGIVVEQLWSRKSDRTLPPMEFCVFVVWGRVYAAVMNEVGADRYLDGFYYRDGTAAKGCPMTEPVPDWAPWGEIVQIAEVLGANKDMIRIDMFVGVPRYAAEDSGLQIAISESEIHPTTIFCNPYIADEMARLWIAGYKMGNYQVIPNSEVPAEYVQKKIEAARARRSDQDSS